MTLKSIEIEKFDMKKIRFNPQKSQGPVIVIAGRRNTGKSFLVRDLLYYHQDIPIGAVISLFEPFAGFYSEFVPKCFIHDECNNTIIENLLKPNQSKKICIFDDSGYRGQELSRLSFNKMLVITKQYSSLVPSNVWDRADYTFILKENINQHRKIIYEKYADIFPNFDVFCTIMDQCTENYECLVIDNNVKSDRIDEQVFWYKASEHEDFKLGSQKFWDMSKDMESDDDTDNDE
tara:strand:+ start:350 stop:1051 length:702 start_codon:yes stop_codon:yes gene_type:complete